MIESKIQNRFTEQFLEFKQIPVECRDEYLSRIVARPMEDTDFNVPDIEPTSYYTIQVQEDGEIIDLVIYAWEPKDKPTGILYFAHGLNGHSGNMAFLLQQASRSLGMVAIGLDYRNFGRSGGTHRGLINSEVFLLEDTELVLNWARKKYGHDLKIFMMGLSMGGAISLKVTNRALVPNIAGVIFVSPAFRMNKHNPLPLTLIHYFQIAFMPRSYLFEPSYTSGCRHKKFIDKLKADKFLYHGKMRAGTIRAAGNLIRSVWEEVPKFTTPYLFIQSGVDKSVDPFIIVDFDKECKSTDKTNMFAKDMWHSACFDSDIYEMTFDIIRWIKDRL